MEKSILFQKKIKDNAEDLHSFMSDMRSWETEMKRKEADLTGVPYQEELPPVRSRIKKPKSNKTQSKPPQRISGLDYKAWDKFDVEKACEKVDEEDMGSPSLDSEMSEKDKFQKLREEAQEEKEKGNQFVKLQKWDEAIACYTRAIELYQDDAIYYANRGLCHLKKESFHAAESDCTKALKLDPTYVKALQRRSCALESLGSLRSASADVRKIIELEPNNLAAKKQLAILTQRIGTKGPNSKTSPATTPVSQKLPELPTPTSDKTVKPNDLPNADKLDNDSIHAINKPPRLRSKEPLIRIPVEEIPLGSSKSVSELLNDEETPKTKTLPEHMRNGNVKNEDDKEIKNVSKVREKESVNIVKENCVDSVNIDNLILEEKEINYQIPKSSVQFLSQWRLLKGRDRARSQYLKLIPPKDIPSIFQNSLESDVLSELLQTLSKGEDFVSIDVGSSLAYLDYISQVKRFGALTMFLSNADKDAINSILSNCLQANKCTQDTAEQIRNKYEI